MEQYNQKSNPWAVDRKSIITLAPNTMSQCKCIKICFLMYLYNMVRNLHQKRTKSCARCDLWARGQGQQNEDRGSTTPTLCCWHRWRHCLTTAMWHKSTEGRESATQHVSLHGARHHNVSNSGAAAAANQCWHIQQITYNNIKPAVTHCNYDKFSKWKGYSISSIHITMHIVGT